MATATITVWFLVALNTSTGETLRTQNYRTDTVGCFAHKARIMADTKFAHDFPEVAVECVSQNYTVKLPDAI